MTGGYDLIDTFVHLCTFGFIQHEIQPKLQHKAAQKKKKTKYS